MRRPGQTKIRLAKILTDALREAGCDIDDIDPADLLEAIGYHRTSNSFDNEALRWEASIPKRNSRLRYWLTSWTTMTAIVKSKGCRLTKDGATHIAIYDATGN